jgi:hypothetical protein
MRLLAPGEDLLLREFCLRVDRRQMALGLVWVLVLVLVLVLGRASRSDGVSVELI